MYTPETERLINFVTQLSELATLRKALPSIRRNAMAKYLELLPQVAKRVRSEIRAVKRANNRYLVRHGFPPLP